MTHLLIIHGPNLNLLGEREPEVYGSLTLDELNAQLEEFAIKLAAEIKWFQSNHEGAIIDFIHEHRKWAQGMVINPAALTHYSYSLRDAISSVNFPTVEVHLSDIHSRESFRQISVIKDVCLDQICGLGIKSYFRGIEKVIAYLKK